MVNIEHSMCHQCKRKLIDLKSPEHSKLDMKLKGKQTVDKYQIFLFQT